MKKESLHVAVNTLATKVLFDANKRETGLEFLRSGVKGSVNAKKEVMCSEFTTTSDVVRNWTKESLRVFRRTSDQ